MPTELKQPDKVAIYLDPHEVELFILFQQYHDEFAKLVTAGVFTMKNGHAEIHADNLGSFRTITIQAIVFKS